MPFPLAIPLGIGIGKAISAALAATAITVATVAVVVAASRVIELVDDYLDEKEREKERIERILDKLGEKSKAEQTRLRTCRNCIWCLIIVQAQGTLVGGEGGSTLSLGPYVVQGRHVWTSEGIVVLGATHALLEKSLGRKDLKEIAKLDAFARTATYIRTRPPGGLPPGYMDYRAGAPAAQNRLFRYDIGVQGTINAFLS